MSFLLINKQTGGYVSHNGCFQGSFPSIMVVTYMYTMPSHQYMAIN